MKTITLKVELSYNPHMMNEEDVVQAVQEILECHEYGSVQVEKVEGE